MAWGWRLFKKKWLQPGQRTELVKASAINRIDAAELHPPDFDTLSLFIDYRSFQTCSPSEIGTLIFTVVRRPGVLVMVTSPPNSNARSRMPSKPNLPGALRSSVVM